MRHVRALRAWHNRKWREKHGAWAKPIVQLERRQRDAQRPLGNWSGMVDGWGTLRDDCVKIVIIIGGVFDSAHRTVEHIVLWFNIADRRVGNIIVVVVFGVRLANMEKTYMYVCFYINVFYHVRLFEYVLLYKFALFH